MLIVSLTTNRSCIVGEACVIWLRVSTMLRAGTEQHHYGWWTIKKITSFFFFKKIVIFSLVHQCVMTPFQDTSFLYAIPKRETKGKLHPYLPKTVFLLESYSGTDAVRLWSPSWKSLFHDSAVPVRDLVLGKGWESSSVCYQGWPQQLLRIL